ncbi:MAG: hypothetical protein ABSA75_11590 [Candidatus Bathyarchaeia archaeon]
MSANVVAAQASPGLYVGVDVAYGGVALTEQLIDNVSSYTNFFVIGCTNNYNETILTTISQYVYDKGMSFVVYTDIPNYPSQLWFENAQSMWGSRFLGIYYYDEAGGKQVDLSKPIVLSAANYSDAANQYVNTMNMVLRSGPFSITNNFAYPTEYKLFTSDYALYWYDYKAGYDTVFAEFGWNYSRQLNVALIRGAATAFNKDWGAVITWTYMQSPYIENGSQLYNDMVLAYENGAKYIVVFDTDKPYTQNILLQGQLDAMKQFWQYTQDHPRTISLASDRTAYVLPQDYGYGFRGPQDKIWGLWPPDNLTLDISMSVATLLQTFGTNLDMVYPNGPQTSESLGYRNILYWNDTRLIPTPTPSPSPVQSVSSNQSTAPSQPQKDLPLLFYATAIGIIVAVAVVTTVLRFRKRDDNQQSKDVT